MDDKTLTALSTTLALFQIQLNAGTVRADFQQLVSEGVASVGLETMKEIKNRIREGIIQQDQSCSRRTLGCSANIGTPTSSQSMKLESGISVETSPRDLEIITLSEGSPFISTKGPCSRQEHSCSD